MIQALVAALGQSLANQGIRMVALKLFMRALIMTALPIAILAGFNLILGELTTFIQTQLQNVDVQSSSGYQITGIGAYLMTEMGITTALSLVIGAFSTKLAIRCIPFLKL